MSNVPSEPTDLPAAQEIVPEQRKATEPAEVQSVEQKGEAEPGEIAAAAANPVAGPSVWAQLIGPVCTLVDKVIFHPGWEPFVKFLLLAILVAIVVVVIVAF